MGGGVAAMRFSKCNSMNAKRVTDRGRSSSAPPSPCRHSRWSKMVHCFHSHSMVLHTDTERRCASAMFFSNTTTIVALIVFFFLRTKILCAVAAVASTNHCSNWTLSQNTSGEILLIWKLSFFSFKLGLEPKDFKVTKSIVFIDNKWNNQAFKWSQQRSQSSPKSHEIGGQKSNRVWGHVERSDHH